MQIQNRMAATSTLEGQQALPGSSQGTGDFAAALAKATTGQNKTVAEKMREEASARAEAANQAYTAAAKSFQDYMSKPLAEHMREAILKEMGLSEDEVKAMPPEKQQAVEAEISRRIRERMLGRKEEGPQTELSATSVRLQQVLDQAQGQVQGVLGLATGTSGSKRS